MASKGSFQAKPFHDSVNKEMGGNKTLGNRDEKSEGQRLGWTEGSARNASADGKLPEYFGY